MILALLFLAATPDPNVARAVAYLAQEVPRWHRENQCYSCHNNGDAARALYTARRAGYRVPPDALADNTQWVKDPAAWESNRGNPAFSDKNLARIQFAGALLDACGDCAEAITRAGELVIQDQRADGSWQVDASGTVGSPVTYGPYLATYMARRTLERSAFPTQAARANAWFAAQHPTATPDRAALVLAMPSRAAEQLPALLDAQNPDGGWGPYRHSPSEAFDTALVLLALKPSEARTRGRAWLIKNQQPEGDWIETTRPAGMQSYAQHISTTGWATLALLATSP